MPSMNIGDAAAAAGVTPKMIRHYETLGLIPEPERTEAGYRLYGEREVAMLRFIRQSRGLGFSTPQIESLLALWHADGRQSRDVRQVASEHLAQLEERQREIDQMRGALQQLVAQCAGDHRSHCAILDSLARSAAPDLSAAPSARRGLKEVKAGTRQPAARRPRIAAPRPAPAHAGLVAWTRSIAQG